MADRDRDTGRRDEGRGRDRGDDRPTDRERGRGGRDGGSRDSGRYSYQARGREDVEKRASQGASEYDKIVKDHIKQWTPSKGDNRIRIVPPTWPEPKHYGYDIWVHYGVGPDRGSYLDLDKMKGEADPITEEYNDLKRSGTADDEDLRQLASKRRVGVYLVDRDDEGEGVQFWAMPWGMDKDIAVVSVDKQSGEVLNIDDPENGYDVEFRKDGEGIKTKYSGISISRRPSRLGSGKWIDFAVDNPIPDVLQFFSYDEIAKAFGGGGAHRERDSGSHDDRDHRGDARGGRDRDRGDDRGARDEDRGRSSSDRDVGGRGRDAGRDRVEEPARTSSRLSWETIHAMTSAELDALVQADERLDKIKPDDAESDLELAGWICEDLGLKKDEGGGRRRAAPPPAADDDAGDRLRKMREDRDRSGSRR